MDEVKTIFSGLHPHMISKLYERFGPFVPGYMHTPQYKLGTWDGKIRFFKKTGETYTYLLEDVLLAIDEYGGSNLPISIIDKRPQVDIEIPKVHENMFSHIIHPKSGKPIILRDYQVNLANELIVNKNGIGKAATGAGKSVILSAMATVFDQVNYTTILIVPDVGLAKQMKADYQMFGLDVGELSGDTKDFGKPHLITTWQSLKNVPHVIKQYNVVMVDETHKAKSTVLNGLLTNQAAHIQYRFGVTGTLPEEEVDRLSVHCALGPLRYEVTAAELIARGVLAAPTIDVWQLSEDYYMKKAYQDYLIDLQNDDNPTQIKLSYAIFKKKYFADYQTEKTYLTVKQSRLEFIANVIKEFMQTRGNIMILVPNIKMGRSLGKLIQGSYVVNGTDMKKADKRQEVYDKFETEDNVCAICTVQIASTGISINRIYTFMYIDIGKSFTRVIQSIGRGLRTAEDKQEVLIVDICSDLHYGNDHLKKRIKFYNDEQYPFGVQKVNYVDV